MRVLHNKSNLCVSKNELSETEKIFIENEEFEGVKIVELERCYIVNGKKEYLFDFLYTVSVVFDIDMV